MNTDQECILPLSMNQEVVLYGILEQILLSIKTETTAISSLKLSDKYNILNKKWFSNFLYFRRTEDCLSHQIKDEFRRDWRKQENPETRI